MSNSRAVIAIGNTKKDDKPTARLKGMVDRFNALSEKEFDNLHNNYFAPVNSSSNQDAIATHKIHLDEILQAIFGSRSSKDPAAVVFKQTCDAETSTPASLAIWLNERAMSKLHEIFIGTAIVEDDNEEANTTEQQAVSTRTNTSSENARWHGIIRAIRRLSPADISNLDKRSDEILRAYTALMLAVLHGSGEAAAALADSLHNGCFNFSALGNSQLNSHQLRIAQIRYFITLHKPLIISNATAISAEQSAISELQSLRGITKYLADWKSEIRNDQQDNKTYLAILTLFEKTQEWLPPATANIQAASNYLLREKLKALPPEVAEIIEIQRLCLAVLVELAPNVSRIMAQQIAQQKVSTVDQVQRRLDTLMSQKAAAEQNHSAIVDPKTQTYATTKISEGFKKSFEKLSEGRRNSLTSEYNAAISASQAAIDNLQSQIDALTEGEFATVKAEYDAVVENFSINDPILVVVRMLLQAIENGIFTFAQVPSLPMASNLEASTDTRVSRGEVDVIAVLERLISQNKLTFAKTGLPFSLSGNDDYMALHQITADVKMPPRERLNRFKLNLEKTLYQNDAISSAKGTVARVTAGDKDILLQHPMIAAFFLVRKLDFLFKYEKSQLSENEQKLAYQERLPEKIARAKKQIYVVVQSIEATFDATTTSDFAQTLRNYLLISAALLLDPTAIMTLRYEESSNPLALEGIVANSEFSDAIKRIGSAEPCYEDALTLITQFKAMVGPESLYHNLVTALASTSLKHFIGKKTQQGERITVDMIRRDYVGQKSAPSRQNSGLAASSSSGSDDGLSADNSRRTSTDSSNNGMGKSAASLVNPSSPSLYDGVNTSPAAASISSSPSLTATADEG